MRLSLVALALTLTTLPAVAQTQAGAPTATLPTAEALPGARVRLVAPSVFAGRFQGTVLSRAGDTLVVARPDGFQQRVPVASLTDVQVSRGKSHSLGARRGALWGAGVSGGLGALIALAAASDTTVKSSEAGAFIGSMAFGGAIWGVGIGAIIGAERWDRASPPLRVGVAPSMSGVRLAVAWSR